MIARFLASDHQPVPIGGRGLVVTTGVGSSEAPARRCAVLLRRVGFPASFAPISAFATSSAPSGAELVVFSQGLSPNAGLALGAASMFERVLLFAPGTERARICGLDVSLRAGVELSVLPPQQEDGILPRVLGPIVASLAAHLSVMTASRGAIADPRKLPIQNLTMPCASAPSCPQGSLGSSTRRRCCTWSRGSSRHGHAIWGGPGARGSAAVRAGRAPRGRWFVTARDSESPAQLCANTPACDGTI